MKRFLLLVSISVSSVLLHAQAVNQTDAKGQKQGVWKKTYENSNQLRYQGQFKDNQPVGTFTYFAKNGKMMTTIDHLSTTVSYAKNYYETGKLTSQGKYINQKKDSVWTFYDEEGNLLSTETYQNDLKNGVAKVYHKNGTVSLEQNFANGIHHGQSIIYFDNGVKRAEDSYENGKLHGESKTYGLKGNVVEVGGYKLGNKEGIWTSYNDDGSVYATVNYNQGEKGKLIPMNGVFEEFFGNELLKARYTYKNGKLNGPFIVYHDGGSWELIEKTDPRTEDKDTYRIEKDHFVKQKGTYLNGVLHGKLEEFDQNGLLSNTLNYINGELK